MKRLNPRHSFAFALLFALLVPILAACGGATTTPGASTGATAPAAEAPTSAPAAGAPTAAPAAEAPTAAPAAEAPTAATGGTAAPAGNVLRIVDNPFPDELNPQHSSFTHEAAVELLNWEGLTRLDKDSNTVPAAAEKWEYNSDATEITFHLRDGLKYSDGSPLKAEEFVKAIQRTFDPHNPGDYQTLLGMVKGADAIINTAIPTDEAKLPDLFKALGVSAPDDKTVKFELTQPTPYFHTMLTLQIGVPPKSDLVEKGGDQWFEDINNLVGNGPFQITKYDKSNNLIELKANENYWAGKPKLDAVQIRYIDDVSVAFQAYKNNEVDMFQPDPNDVPTIKADATLSKEYTEYPGSCSYAIAFNLTKPPFDNPKVRQAFSMAFDRDAYIHDALKDTELKSLSWIPKGIPGYDESEKRFDFDAEKAKATLAEAGFANGEGLPELKYTYSTSNPANQARAEYIAQMFQKNLGVTVTPDPVEAKTLVAMRKSVDTFPQMTRAGWCSDYPDAQDWLSVVFASDQEFAKDVGYKNPEFDKLTKEADVSTDAKKRADLYDQAQKLLIGDVPQIQQSTTKNYFLVKPYVKGLDFTPSDTDFPGQLTHLINVTIEK